MVYIICRRIRVSYKTFNTACIWNGRCHPLQVVSRINGEHFDETDEPSPVCTSGRRNRLTKNGRSFRPEDIAPALKRVLMTRWEKRKTKYRVTIYELQNENVDVHSASRNRQSFEIPTDPKQTSNYKEGYSKQI